MPKALNTVNVVLCVKVEAALLKRANLPLEQAKYTAKIPYATEQVSVCATTTEPVLWSPGAATTEAHVPCSLSSARREATTTRSLRTATRAKPHLSQSRKLVHSKEDSVRFSKTQHSQK